MESGTKEITGKQRYARLGTLFVFLLFAGIAIWWSSRMTSVMWSAAASDPNAAQAKAGEVTKIVMEIAEATGDGRIRGTILKKKTEDIYTRTTGQIHVTTGSETKFVMGKPVDVRVRAVVHLTGVMQQDHSVAAQRVVILTGYVKIE